MNKNLFKNILIWIAIFLLLTAVINFFTATTSSWDKKENLNFSELMHKVENHDVKIAKLQGPYVNGILKDGTSFSTYIGGYSKIISDLKDYDVEVEILPPDTKMNSFMSIFISWFPMILLIGVWVFFMRQMQKGNKGFGFNKSKPKFASDKGPKVTFDDVAGIDEAKSELTELVEFLRDPARFQRLGGNIPKGCLLVGPPGAGKTMLAKAIAGEASVPFFNISGSDFVEMFVGVGASRVRDLFEQGKKNSPCIIFIDEIDAVGRQRGVGLGGGNDEREQTLNQLLVEMDGFEANEGVIIVAATNRPDVLDKALLRPGRFDRQITVTNPDIKGREKILNVHMKKIKHDEEIDVSSIAKITVGFSGAELANLVNEAAILAARRNKKKASWKEFDDALDKMRMGHARHNAVFTEEQRTSTAYHEAGHAIVGIFLSQAEPIYKGTIVPRGSALGFVAFAPETDIYTKRKDQMLASISVAMGGRIAEELIFGADKISTGAGGGPGSDFHSAKQIAKSMVMYYGMSDKIGPVHHDSGNEYSPADRSELTSQMIDQEIKFILEERYKIAKEILTKHIDKLHLLAKALKEHETLTGKEMTNIIHGKERSSTEEIKIEYYDLKKKKKSK